MPKRKKYSKKKSSSKSKKTDLGPINGFIDFLGILAMAWIASGKEQKHQYTKKGKINPYTETMLGIETGLIKDKKDFVRNGAILGALGSFDDDDDPLFDTGNFSKVNDNRYAWRLNCEDGTEYGVDPKDYETRDEYNEALHEIKYEWRDYCEDGSDYGIDPEDYETEEEYEEALEEAKELIDEEDEMIDSADDDYKPEAGNPSYAFNAALWEAPSDTTASAINTDTYKPIEPDPFADDDFHVYVYCLVKLENSEVTKYFRTEDHSLRKGDMVRVPDFTNASRYVTGEIVSVEHHMRFSAPTPIAETPVIIEKA